MRRNGSLLLSSLLLFTACSSAEEPSGLTARRGPEGKPAVDAGGGARATPPGESSAAPGAPSSTSPPEKPATPPGTACDAGPDAKRPGWNLSWCDEFNGAAIDTAKWRYEIGDGGDLPAGPGWGNQELQYYTARAKNAQVENGNLVITAVKDGPHFGNGQAATYDYSSARLTTKGKADFRYGRIEVRAKLPTGQGLWPAIWMLPTETPYGGWPASGEIDIMESRGQEANKLWGTLHFGDQWPRNKFAGCIYTLANGSFADDFHTFAVEWDAGSIKWTVDGTLYAAQSAAGKSEAGAGTTCTASAANPETNHSGGWYSSGGDAPAPFDRRFHVILNVAVGGKFGGPAGGAFPQAMTVDYVRVYEKSL